MTEENVAERFPALNLPGQVLQVIVLVLYGSILLKISCEDERY